MAEILLLPADFAAYQAGQWWVLEPDPTIRQFLADCVSGVCPDYTAYLGISQILQTLDPTYFGAKPIPAYAAQAQSFLKGLVNIANQDTFELTGQQFAGGVPQFKDEIQTLGFDTQGNFIPNPAFVPTTKFDQDALQHIYNEYPVKLPSGSISGLQLALGFGAVAIAAVAPQVAPLITEFLGGGAEAASSAGEVAAIGADTSTSTAATAIDITTSDIGTGLTSGTVVAGGAVATTTGAVLSSVGSAISTASSAVKAVVSPITSAIDSVTSIFKEINDSVIQPILGPITTTIREIDTLTTEIHNLTKEGISGFLKIPGAITDALVGIDASFDRSLRQLGEISTQTAEKILAPSIGNAARPGLDNLGLTVRNHFSGSSDHIAAFGHVTLGSPLERNEKIKQIEDFVAGLKNDTSYIGQAANYLIQAAKYVFTFPALLEPIVEIALAEAKRVERPSLLDVATSLAALRKGIISETDFRSELAGNGFSDERIQALIDNDKFVFDADAVARLKLRGIISPTDADEAFKALAMSADDIDAQQLLSQSEIGIEASLDAFARGIIDEQSVRLELQKTLLTPEAQDLAFLLRIDPPSFQQAIAAAANRGAANIGFFDTFYGSAPPDRVLAFGRAQRKSDEEINDAWQAHWNAIGVELSIQMFFRGLLDREEVGFVIGQNNLPPAIVDDLIEASRPLLERRTIPTLLANGSISEAFARDQLQKLGFAPEIIDALLIDALMRKDTKKATKAQQLHELSLAEADQAFNDGIIDAEQYKQLIIAHDFAPDAADIIVQLAEIKQARAARNDFVATIETEVQIGVRTIDDAIQALYQAGLSQAEVEKASTRFRQAKSKAAKLPTQAELFDMAKKNVIDMITLRSTLVLSGFSQIWADRLIELHFPTAGQ